MDQINQLCKTLSQNPFGGEKHGKLKNFYPPYRYKIRTRSGVQYRVFYDIEEESKTVIIHAIRKRDKAYN
jgi:mRNA-degrading endonuclease RelE of RelBE toxin-antitoxin system